MDMAKLYMNNNDYCEEHEHEDDEMMKEEEEEVVFPGFRFHPTEEELVAFYLSRKIDKKTLNIELIKQIDIYKYDPWDLPKLGTSLVKPHNPRWKTRQMYYYFSGTTGHGYRSREIPGELMNAELIGGFDSKTCQDFLNWFTTIDSSGSEHHYDEFKTLCNSDSFYDLCNYLYNGRFRMDNDWNQISLISSEGSVTKIDKRVAAAESEVLSAFTGGRGGDTPRRLVPRGDEIPLKNLSGKIVSKITQFMRIKHDFSRELKNLVNNYKGWFTQYLKLNRTMLSGLHDAAEFLNIKSLFNLTGKAVMELGGGRTIKEITEWCGKLSFSEMLSSLVVGVQEDLRDRDRDGPSLLPFASQTH